MRERKANKASAAKSKSPVLMGLSFRKTYICVGNEPEPVRLRLQSQKTNILKRDANPECDLNSGINPKRCRLG